MPIDSVHPEYSANVDRWRKNRDAVSGSDAVKRGRERYLPKPNKLDTSALNSYRYDAYINRANFVNFSGFTLRGLTGLVFRKEPEYEIPEALEPIVENATGSGVTLEQLVAGTISELITVGRRGLLVDYPAIPEGVTAADINAYNPSPVIAPYDAETVINWQTVTIYGKKRLSLVVLSEMMELPGDDEYTMDKKQVYRVLYMRDGAYHQILMDDDGLPLSDEITPRKANGATWDEIPFILVGAVDNDPCVDAAPLSDIVDINIGHYRNSADYEESCFIVGQPTPWASGLTQTWVEDNFKNGVAMGSASFIPLPNGGAFGLAQVLPNSQPREAMQDKEAQMIAIGARIIQDSAGSQETAEAAKIRFAGQTSQLAALVTNAEDAIIQCLNWCAEFLGITGDIDYNINRSFYEATVDPQMIIAQIQMVDRGLIAKTDFRANMRKFSVIDDDRSDEEIDAEAEVAAPVFSFGA